MPIGRLNYINVGPGGTFKDSGLWRSTVEDVDNIIDHQEEIVHPIASFRGAGRDTRVGLILAQRVFIPRCEDGRDPAAGT